MLCEFGSRAAGLAASMMSSMVSPRCASVTVYNVAHRRDYSSIKVLCVPAKQYSSTRILSQQTSPASYTTVCRHCTLIRRQTQTSLSVFDSVGQRWFSVSSEAGQKRKAIVEKKTSSDGQQLTMGQKVAQTSKDVSYAGIIVIGIGVTAIMFFTLGKELFSSNSPNGVYTKAYKLCKNNVEIQDALGTPIKGYGEMTRRKRRRHVSHLEYSQDGVNFMRMKFYLEGPHRKGTVHLEMKQNESGKYEYRYLFVELDGYPSGTIVLEDNRR